LGSSLLDVVYILISGPYLEKLLNTKGIDSIPFGLLENTVLSYFESLSSCCTIFVKTDTDGLNFLFNKYYDKVTTLTFSF